MDLSPVPFPTGKGCLLDPSAARIVAYLDSFPLSRDLRQARLASLRQLQSATGEELDALLPSVLDRAFSGRL
jgi:hypothetical protein